MPSRAITASLPPSTPAPDENSTYVPGCWVHRETRFFWRPGYWVAVNPDWCWTPDRYVWTPSGCLFVKGFWDHPLHERGLLFAPVRFDPTHKVAFAELYHGHNERCPVDGFHWGLRLLFDAVKTFCEA